MNFLTRKSYSPYVAGIIIGLLQIPIFLTLHASIGSSGAFNSAACSILSWFSDSGITSTASQCFAVMKHWWQLGFVLGIMIGAYLSSMLSKTKRLGFSPIWPKITNINSLGKRSIMAFIGGFIMLIGARIADGCTSGNGISGIALLSVGSMVVITAMFVSGVLVVRLYKK